MVLKNNHFNGNHFPTFSHTTVPRELFNSKGPVNNLTPRLLLLIPQGGVGYGILVHAVPQLLYAMSCPQDLNNILMSTTFLVV